MPAGETNGGRLSAKNSVELLVLAVGKTESFFIISEPPPSHSNADSGEKTGFLQKVKAAVLAAYEALRKRFDYQENVCAHLRHTEALCLVHSPNIQPDEAVSRLKAFLLQRVKKHRKWLIIDTIFALLGSLLTPIPGPNIFGLYPAARALSHYFAYKGTQKVSRISPLPTRLEPRLARLEQNIQNLDVVRLDIEELGKSYNIEHLRTLLEKI